MTVGDRIRDRRKSLKLTQEELGKKLGWGRSAVCRVEKEGNNITTDRIAKIAKALNCTPSYLMGWSTSAEQTTIFDFIDIDSIPCDEHGYPMMQTPLKYSDAPEEKDFTVNEEEFELIEKYRVLSKEWKTVVNASIENGYLEYKNRLKEETALLPPFSPPWNNLDGFGQ